MRWRKSLGAWCAGWLVAATLGAMAWGADGAAAKPGLDAWLGKLAAAQREYLERCLAADILLSDPAPVMSVDQSRALADKLAKLREARQAAPAGLDRQLAELLKQSMELGEQVVDAASAVGKSRGAAENVNPTDQLRVAQALADYKRGHGAWTRREAALTREWAATLRLLAKADPALAPWARSPLATTPAPHLSPIAWTWMELSQGSTPKNPVDAGDAATAQTLRIEPGEGCWRAYFKLVVSQPVVLNIQLAGATGLVRANVLRSQTGYLSLLRPGATAGPGLDAHLRLSLQPGEHLLRLAHLDAPALGEGWASTGVSARLWTGPAKEPPADLLPKAPTVTLAHLGRPQLDELDPAAPAAQLGAGPPNAALPAKPPATQAAQAAQATQAAQAALDPKQREAEAAQLLEGAGNLIASQRYAAALPILKAIASDYPDTAAAEQAKDKLRMLARRGIR